MHDVADTPATQLDSHVHLFSDDGGLPPSKHRSPHALPLSRPAKPSLALRTVYLQVAMRPIHRSLGQLDAFLPALLATDGGNIGLVRLSPTRVPHLFTAYGCRINANHTIMYEEARLIEFYK